MPRLGADQIIMFSVIGLVSWGIIGLPVLKSLEQSEPHQQSGTPQPTGNERQQPAAKDSQPETRPAVTAQKSRPYGPDNSNTESRSKDWAKIFLDHLPDWFVALFTAVLSLFTGLLWWSTDKLWKAGERQMALIGKNAEMQSADMRRSIEAAEHANQISRDSLISSQRPWLTLIVLIQSDFKSDKNTGSLGLEVTVENVGNGPAFAIKCMISTYPGKHKGTEIEAFKTFVDTMARSGWTPGFGESLYPNRGVLQWRDSPVTARWHQENIAQEDAEKPLAIFVCIDYVSGGGVGRFQNAVALMPMKKTEGGNWSSFKISENIPMSNLRLYQHPVGRHVT